MKTIQKEQLATEILDFLIANGMWVDVRIYFDGRVWGSHNKETDEFYYNEKDKVVEEKAEPKDYFDYVAEPHILSMSFEGGFYDVLNGTSERAFRLQNQFNNILAKYGLYYELGNAWNLTLYQE